MNKPLILNLVWAGVAGAAFYTGMKLNSSGENTGGSTKIRPVMASAGPTGPAGSKGVSPLLESKNEGVLDFYKRLGLDSGTPISPDKMKEAVMEAIGEPDSVKLCDALGLDYVSCSPFRVPVARLAAAQAAIAASKK